MRRVTLRLDENPSFIARELARLLKRGRTACGYTQAEVAASLGIARPIVARTERGVYEPELYTALRYLALYEIPVSDLGRILDEASEPADGRLMLRRDVNLGREPVPPRSEPRSRCSACARPITSEAT